MTKICRRVSLRHRPIATFSLRWHAFSYLGIIYRLSTQATYRVVLVLVIRERHIPLTRRWVAMCCNFLSLTATNSANIFFRTNSPGDMPPPLSPSAGLELTSAEAIRVCLRREINTVVNKGGTSLESSLQNRLASFPDPLCLGTRPKQTAVRAESANSCQQIRSLAEIARRFAAPFVTAHQLRSFESNNSCELVLPPEPA